MVLASMQPGAGMMMPHVQQLSMPGMPTVPTTTGLPMGAGQPNAVPVYLQESLNRIAAHLNVQRKTIEECFRNISAENVQG